MSGKPRPLSERAIALVEFAKDVIYVVEGLRERSEIALKKAKEAEAVYAELRDARNMNAEILRVTNPLLRPFQDPKDMRDRQTNARLLLKKLGARQ